MFGSTIHPSPITQATNKPIQPAAVTWNAVAGKYGGMKCSTTTPALAATASAPSAVTRSLTRERIAQSTTRNAVATRSAQMAPPNAADDVDDGVRRKSASHHRSPPATARPRVIDQNLPF